MIIISDKFEIKLFFNTFSVIYLLSARVVFAWREASKCTNGVSSVDNSAISVYDLPVDQSRNGANANNPKILKLDCDSNFIFIAWTHYGHQTPESKSAGRQHQQSQFDSNSTDSNTCYFSPKDCIVSVDYVANECNGLSSCQISLDAQYLHSCKAYSDYLFIVYECVEGKLKEK
jgi:hypothetical protein